MDIGNNMAQMFTYVSLKDWLTIVAIISAPICALWIQSKLDERKEVRKRRLNV